MDNNKDYLKNIVIQNRTIIKMLQIIMLSIGTREDEIARLIDHLQREAATEIEMMAGKRLDELNNIRKE